MNQDSSLFAVNPLIKSNRKKSGPKRIHFSLLIFSVCLLFTVLLWDHYFNSEYPPDRDFVSTIVLGMGALFSVTAGLFVWALELELETLRGFISLCANCKKVRNDEGRWEQLELYFQRHSKARFSHGICPDCMMKLYPGYARKGLVK